MFATINAISGSSPASTKPVINRNFIAFSVVLCAAVRLAFSLSTGTTLEDALITARYAENIAAGRGFVYNQGEHILGTTAPLWALVLALMSFVSGLDVPVVARILGTMLDCVTLILVLFSLRSATGLARILFVCMFAFSPLIVPLTGSGMETPLVLFGMAAMILSWERPGLLFAVGIAVTLVSRIDGIIFVGIIGVASMLHSRARALRQLIIGSLLCLPWLVYAFATFGSIIPQSLIAKKSVYDYPFHISALPFLMEFTPIGETNPLEFAVRTFQFLLLAAAAVLILRRMRRYAPLIFFSIIYSILFMLSGTAIFSWYLAPPVFVANILISAGVGEYFTSGAIVRAGARVRLLAVGTVLCFLIATQVGMLSVRFGKYRQLQMFEDEVRRTIGLWLFRNTPAGSVIVLEPVGYIGYYCGWERIVYDEVGIVAPEVAKIRERSAHWYPEILRLLSPDYIVQYGLAIERNVAEGTGTALFEDSTDVEWFQSEFVEATRIDVRERFPMLDDRERYYIVFRRRVQQK